MNTENTETVRTETDGRQGRAQRFRGRPGMAAGVVGTGAVLVAALAFGGIAMADTTTSAPSPNSGTTAPIVPDGSYPVAPDGTDPAAPVGPDDSQVGPDGEPVPPAGSGVGPDGGPVPPAGSGVGPDGMALPPAPTAHSGAAAPAHAPSAHGHESHGPKAHGPNGHGPKHEGGPKGHGPKHDGGPKAHHAPPAR